MNKPKRTSLTEVLLKTFNQQPPLIFLSYATITLMSYLPLDTVKLFLDLFEVLYLREYNVSKFSFDEYGLEKIYLIDNELILYVSITPDKNPRALNAKELFKSAHGPGNRFVHLPDDNEVYYQLEIEELTPNTINFQINQTEFIDRLEMLTGFYPLDLDISYSRFSGWRRPYWCQDRELTVEKIHRFFPELQLKERYEKWPGIEYHFAILKLPQGLTDLYAIAYFRAHPENYLDRFVKRYLTSGTISSEIRGGYNFSDGYKAVPKRLRRKNLEKITATITSRHFREKDDVWRYADELLIEARNEKFANDFKPLFSLFPKITPKPEPEIELERFLKNQNFTYYHDNGKIKNTTYERLLDSIKQRKFMSNIYWINFIFPQLKGYGWDELNNRIGLRSFHEAVAYYEHPILKPRLEESLKVLMKAAKKGFDVRDILGTINTQKLHACLTLFSEIDPNNRCFKKALDKFFAGEKDPATLDLLEKYYYDSHPRL